LYVPTNGHGVAHTILGAGDIWEEETIDFVIKNCKNKSIISAGSFIGDFIIPFAKNTLGNVITFEPEPQNIIFFKKNIQINNLNNIIFSDCGLSNKKNDGYLKYKGAWYGSQKINEDDINVDYLGETAWVVEESNEKYTVPIKLTDLDTFLFENNITEEISVIQLDIEGCEMLALEGAKKTIEKNLPIIIIETIISSDIYEIFLKNLGYTVSEKKIGHVFENGQACLNTILFIPNKHDLIF
jgi:FkbM family methyltransferase